MTSGADGASFHSFSAVDGLGERAALLVRTLDAHHANPSIQAVRQRTLELLAPRQGGAYLDVGCGASSFALELAALVGPAGRIVGVDASEAMVAVSWTRAAALRDARGGNGQRVEFHVADAQQLPFEDAAFDGVRCERVLTYVPDPLRAIGEMARVAKPGAPVVVTEADWATYVFDLPGVERALIQKFVRQINDGVAAGWIGRSLPRALKDAGLRDVTVSVGGLIYPSGNYFLDIDTGRASFERLVAEGRLTANEAAGLVAGMEQADRVDRFFGAVTLFTACGWKAAD